MSDINRLRELTQQARNNREASKRKDSIEKRERMLEAAQKIFDKAFPILEETVESIARKGWSHCGFEFPESDYIGKSGRDHLEARHLCGVGKLLFNEVVDRGLNPVITYALYDLPPDCPGSGHRFFIVIDWKDRFEREKQKVSHVNDLRRTTPLIGWSYINNTMNVSVEYPDK